MEAVTLTTLRRRAFTSLDAFDLLTDGASGTLDAMHPLNERPVRFWDGLPPAGGHLYGGHMVGGHLDAMAPDGHLSNMHLLDEHCWPAAPLPWTTRPFYFGLFQFAVRVMDRVGNLGDVSAAQPRVINSAPRPARTLSKSSYDAPTQRLTFTLTPSPDL